MNDNTRHPSAIAAPRTCWWWDWEAAALGVLVLAVYFSRLTAVPICGEESRWAAAAREMIATGDWIVPRQQGALFAERPPLGSWAMALVGLARGQVDLVAIRLPSALATLGLVWLIYAYARTWTSRFAALAAAAAYATCGQVMLLGRLGESEAVFTLLTAGSLLVWHAGYLRARSMTLVWTAGYTLAALGTLTKGLQAPVYFVAACVVFLAVRRDWRWLFSAAHLVGMGAYCAIVGVWLVPFALGNRHALDDVWMGLIQDRFTVAGLPRHLLSYPVETMICLLPWSPLLFGLAYRSVRQSLWANRPQVGFLLVALAVTYPTVWLAAGARGRYYMPLYPLVAVLVALVIEHCTAEGVSRRDFAVWRRFLRGMAATAVAGGVLLVAISAGVFDLFADARQPTWFLLPWGMAAGATTWIMLWCTKNALAPWPQIGLLSAAAFAGLASGGAVINARIQGANDLHPAIAELKQQLPEAGELVSLGRVYHRFAYSYQRPIRQVPWPLEAEDLPEDVTYFCFDRRPGDTPQERAGNDDRLGAHTPGTLPFAWEKVAEIPCDPVKRATAHRSVIIGRVRRAVSVAEQPDATRPARR